MFGRIIIALFFITSSWAADYNKKDVEKIERTFKKIKGVGVIQNDCCSGKVEIGKVSTITNATIQNFANHVKNLPDHATLLKTSRDGQCAKGVRTSLNILFGESAGHGEDLTRKYGRPAKEFDEKILLKWRTAKSCFKNVQDNNKTFKNFDIRVIQPKNNSFAGHIEIYYDGVWHSDFQQGGTYWDGGNGETWKSSKLYRLSPC